MRSKACFALVAALSLAACKGNSAGSPAQGGETAKLGELIFNDPSLSASGRQSCASCHDAAHGHANPTLQPHVAGGPNLDQPGFRDPPSLRYLQSNPAFFFDDEGTPTGGFTRDGRASSLADQASRPLLGANEMANADAAAVVAKLRAAPYAAKFDETFGKGALDDVDAAFLRARIALQAFQSENPEFHRFDSKYDAFLAGRTRLSEQEMRGLSLFNDPDKGNCAACHPSARGPRGEPPLFTDFTYDNLGVPRNPDLPANANASYYDLGLCGPLRTDLATRADLCGAFKVPTLRNVAVTAPYFHNGRFTTLEEAVQFYVRRDTHPEEFYPRKGDGTIDLFDDVPPQYRANVNRTEAPYNKNPGDPPALNDAEVADVVAFLKTLTDGYVP